MIPVIKKTVKNIKPLDTRLYKKAFDHIDNLTKPKGSLGRLEEIAAEIFCINNGQVPERFKKGIYVFAADHGIAQQGVSAYPKDVTFQMVLNFLKGGAGINVLGRHAQADVFVVDVGVDQDFKRIKGLIDKKIRKGTRDFTKGPAMTRKEALQSISTGILLANEAVDNGYTLLAPGDMGIGNTTASSAVIMAASKEKAENVVGYGTGIDEKKKKLKIAVVKKGVSLNKPDKNDPVDILQKVGGYEIGAICGFILGCAERKVPVVADGFISAAGAMLAGLFTRDALDYTFFSHRSAEKGHRVFFRHIKQTPIFDFNLRLGEGTGAALAFMIIDAAVKIFHEMATFEEASVSRKSR